MESEEIWYSALFVTEPKKVIKKFPPKHSKVYAHHLTIEFKPKSLEGIEVGKIWSIRVIGRAFDDKGDALLVENEKSKNKFPHITLSCSVDTDPVCSNELIEKAKANNTIEYVEPYFIEAIEGYETTEGNVFPKQIQGFKK